MIIHLTELTRLQLKVKGTPITLKQAVDSYNERVEFVQHSSSACVVSHAVFNKKTKKLVITIVLALKA